MRGKGLYCLCLTFSLSLSLSRDLLIYRWNHNLSHWARGRGAEDPDTKYLMCINAVPFSLFTFMEFIYCTVHSFSGKNLSAIFLFQHQRQTRSHSKSIHFVVTISRWSPPSFRAMPLVCPWKVAKFWKICRTACGATTQKLSGEVGVSTVFCEQLFKSIVKKRTYHIIRVS